MDDKLGSIVIINSFILYVLQLGLDVCFLSHQTSGATSCTGFQTIAEHILPEKNKVTCINIHASQTQCCSCLIGHC